jgi:hypothetical protein
MLRAPNWLQGGQAFEANPGCLINPIVGAPIAC